MGGAVGGNGRAGSGRRGCGEGRRGGGGAGGGAHPVPEDGPKAQGSPRPRAHKAGAEGRAAAVFTVAWPTNSLNEI